MESPAGLALNLTLNFKSLAITEANASLLIIRVPPSFSLSLSLSLSLHAIKSSSGSFDHFLDTLKRIRARALTG